MLTASEMLPPRGRSRRYERKALEIRRFAGVKLDEPLDPYRLADYARLRVISLDDLCNLSAEVRSQLLEGDPGGWSGGTSQPLPDGSRVVVLNPMHGKDRQAATLMEEVCHVLLGHHPNRVGVAVSGHGGAARDYDHADEEEAYAVGAAVLVPYHVLLGAVEAHLPLRPLAKRYGVSYRLVEYRLKVSGLWESFSRIKGPRS